MLAQHFIRRFSNPDRPTDGITWRAWNALAEASVSGNVRELMHTIQHAVLLSAGGKIDLEHLPTAIRGKARTSVAPARSTDGAARRRPEAIRARPLVHTLATSTERRRKRPRRSGSPGRTSGRSSKITASAPRKTPRQPRRADPAGSLSRFITSLRQRASVSVSVFEFVFEGGSRLAVFRLAWVESVGNHGVESGRPAA